MDPKLIPETNLAKDPITTPSMILPSTSTTGGGGSWGDGAATTTVDGPAQAASDPTSVAAIDSYNRELESTPSTGGSQPSPKPDTDTSGYTADYVNIIANQANYLKTQVDNLAAKEATTADNAVVSDAPVVLSEEEAVADLELKTSKPSWEPVEILEMEIDRIQSDLNAQLASINQVFDATKKQFEGQQQSETGQTSMGIAEAGGYLGFSGSGQGVMLNLAKSHRDELASLAAKREQALASARDAASKRRFDLVRDFVSEVGRIDQETYNREQDYFNNKLKLQNEETGRAQTLKVQTDISNAIASGAKTPQAIFDELDGSATIDEINKFLEGITPADSEGFKFTATQTANLLGAGLSIDDIQAISEYVAENGYDDKVKELITPTQKAALDKVFGQGVATSGAGGGYWDFTDQEKRKLEQASLLNAPRQEQLDFLYAKDNTGDLPFDSMYTQQILDGQTTVDSLPFELQADVRTELLNLGFGSSVVPQYYKDYVENEMMQTLSGDALQSSWNTYRLKALGEYEEPQKQSRPWFASLYENNI